MSDIPETLTLPVGASCEIELPGFAMAGYRWNHTVQGDPDIVEVSWRRGTSATRGQSAAVGVSSPECVTIRAILPGRLTVQLFQHRPWETVTAPRRQHTIVVRAVPSAPRPA